MDNGPWKLWFADGLLMGVASHETDIGLVVTGDFPYYDEKLAYCEWLRDVLNGEDV